MARIIGDLDDLLVTIEHASRGEADQKETEAEQQVRQIEQGAQEKARQIRDQILHKARADAERQHRQRLAQAVRESRYHYLTVREELLDQVWQKAEAKLRALPDDPERYTEVLRQLAWLAVRTLGPGEFRVAADSKGHALLNEERLKQWSAQASDALQGKVSLACAEAPIDTWGGLMVAESKGRRRVDLSFASRLQLAREEIRDAVFARLIQERHE